MLFFLISQHSDNQYDILKNIDKMYFINDEMHIFFG